MHPIVLGALPCILAVPYVQNEPGTSPLLPLQSASSPRSPGSYQWKVVFRSTDLGLSIFTAPGVSCSQWTGKECKYALRLHVHIHTNTHPPSHLDLVQQLCIENRESTLIVHLQVQLQCNNPVHFHFSPFPLTTEWFPSPLMDPPPGNDLTPRPLRRRPPAQVTPHSGPSHLPPHGPLMPRPGHPSGDTLLSLLGLCHPAWMPSPTSDSL